MKFLDANLFVYAFYRPKRKLSAREQRMNPPAPADLIVQLMSLDSLIVESVDRDDYMAAAELGRDLNRDPNDALGVIVMREHRIREIYSYDLDFDGIEGVERLPQNAPTRNS